MSMPFRLTLVLFLSIYLIHVLQQSPSPNLYGADHGADHVFSVEICDKMQGNPKVIDPNC